MSLSCRHMLALTALTLTRPARARARARDLPRILCFGDSLTAGYGLAPGEGLVPQLSDWLTLNGHPARLIDGGLSGDTTYGGRVRIKLSMRRHHPDAVIVALGGNDMLRGWQAAQAEENLDAILTAAGRRRKAAAAGGHPGCRPRRRMAAHVGRHMVVPRCTSQCPAAARSLCLTCGCPAGASGAAAAARRRAPVEPRYRSDRRAPRSSGRAAGQPHDLSSISGLSGPHALRHGHAIPGAGCPRRPSPLRCRIRRSRR